MREILFRGKSIDNGEWVNGFYVKTCNDFDRCKFYHWIYIGFVGVTINGLENVKFEVDPKTVGQYTGLKDSTGKRIFEGDVIENKDDEGGYTNFVIEWINQEAGFFARYIDKKHGENLLNLGDYKAIGNIHDNPELMEVQG